MSRAKPNDQWSSGALKPDGARVSVSTASLSSALRRLGSREKNDRARAIKDITTLIENLAYDQSRGAIDAVVEELNGKLMELADGAEVHERLAATELICELADLEEIETSTKVTSFSNYVRLLLGDAQWCVIESAAKAFGRLSSLGGTLTADFVEFEAKRSLEVLNDGMLAKGKGESSRHYASVLVIRELVIHAPTVFNTHVSDFFENVWPAVKNPKSFIRREAAESLGACLRLLRQRDSKYRMSWYEFIVAQVNSLIREKNPSAVHGGFLTMNEMLLNTDDFMTRHFDDAWISVLQCKSHRDRDVREAVAAVIGSMAAYSPDHFADMCMQAATKHLCEGLRKNPENGFMYACLDRILAAMKERAADFQADVFKVLRETLSVKKRPPPEEALQLLGTAAETFGNAAEEDVSGVLRHVYELPLCRKGVVALAVIAKSIPRLATSIEGRLVALLCQTLAGSADEDGAESAGAHGYGHDESAKDLGARSGALGATGRFADGAAASPAARRSRGFFAALRLGDTGAGGGGGGGSGSDNSSDERGKGRENRSYDKGHGAWRGGGGAAGDGGDGQGAGAGDPRGSAAAFAGGSKGGPADASAADGTHSAGRRPRGRGRTISSDAVRDTVLLAMDALNIFPFQRTYVARIVRELVVLYLDNADTEVRKKAAVTCCELLLATPLRSKRRDVAPAGLRDVLNIIDRLLEVAIADPEPHIRFHVLSALDLQPGFANILSQSRFVRSLFFALNDEFSDVRIVAIGLIGRVLKYNPAYVLPVLRRSLLKLLTDLEFATDERIIAERARLLAHMIRIAGQLVEPYAPVIFRIICEVAKNTQPSVTSSAFLALGEAALAVPSAAAEHMPRVLPLILDALSDLGSPSKRCDAMRTLERLVSSTGMAVQPYRQYRQLLPLLLANVRDNHWYVRREVMKVIGTLGALDPHDLEKGHSRAAAVVVAAMASKAGASDFAATAAAAASALVANASATASMRAPGADNSAPSTPASRRSSAASETETPTGEAGTAHPLVGEPGAEHEEDGDADVEITAEERDAVALLDAHMTLEEKFRTVALHALLAILRDATLNKMHQDAVSAVMFVFKSTELKCVPFLPQVVPTLVQITETTTNWSFRETLIQQITALVVHVRLHIRRYVKDLVRIACKYWDSKVVLPCTNLVIELYNAIREEFGQYLSDVVPPLLKVLRYDQAVRPRRSALARALVAVTTIGVLLEDYIDLFIPALMGLYGLEDAEVSVRCLAIQAVGSLSRSLNVSEYASRILHPIARVLGDPLTGTELMAKSADTLCIMVSQLGSDFAVFEAMFHRILHRSRPHQKRYRAIVARSLATQPWSASFDPDTIGPDGHVVERADAAATQGRSAESTPHPAVPKKLMVSEYSLQRSWEVSQCSTADDWNEWLRRFSVNLLHESPSPALKSCSGLAQVYHPLAQRLFNAAFVSCWTELAPRAQSEIVAAFNTAFSSPELPPEVLQNLLSLAEFMERDERPLPIEGPVLSRLALQCHAHAKALHYKELEYEESNSVDAVGDLIHIYNLLQLPDSAEGIVVLSRKEQEFSVREEWYEKLGKWEDALEAYSTHVRDEPASQPGHLGYVRSLMALGELQQAHNVVRALWDEVRTPGSGRSARSRSTEGGLDAKTLQHPDTIELTTLAARTAWSLHRWDELQEFVAAMPKGSSRRSFYKTVLCVHQQRADKARACIAKTRQLIDTELVALVGESYSRAYEKVVLLQQLVELEEALEYQQHGSESPRAQTIRRMWQERFSGIQRDVRVMQDILSVRSLVLEPEHALDAYIDFTNLCRHERQNRLLLNTLSRLSGINLQSFSASTPLPDSINTRVAYAYVRAVYEMGHRDEAIERLEKLLERRDVNVNKSLAARMSRKLGMWQLWHTESLTEPVASSILENFVRATKLSGMTQYKPWHSLGFMHARILANKEDDIAREGEKLSKDVALPDSVIRDHVAPAVDAFARCVQLSQGRDKSHMIQSTLRLLSLWFKYGARGSVTRRVEQALEVISVATWLEVIPQLIARIQTPIKPVRQLLHRLLCRIGEKHPQALIYSLAVAEKSTSIKRRRAATDIMNRIREYDPILVEQAQLVSTELIRCAILWHEHWHSALEEASRLYFSEKNADGMLSVLEPLHKFTDKPETAGERTFLAAYGRELKDAHRFSQLYRKSGSQDDLDRAWALYCTVFRRIDKQLPQMMNLELTMFSPRLLEARDLKLAVPGSYSPNRAVRRIRSFTPQLSVISSKQRPRRMLVLDDRGEEHTFLLKGNEDIRQDERVMQVFGLVNTMLARDHGTAKQGLSIRQVAVVPLSTRSGLIGWAKNCDTFHSLIREHRESHRIRVNTEHRVMMGMAPHYDHLTVVQKEEVFSSALAETSGDDFARVLWLKSPSSEKWLVRRTNFTRSLAVMSMVGYILGLGDRHPSNLMLDRFTGHVVHIDFGDCFEVSMTRERFPEKIPFRLTRMLVKALEPAGVHGSFRLTSERVMGVLREHNQSLMAMLEAFVYDPLIDWKRLAGKEDREAPDSANQSRREARGDASASGIGLTPLQPLHAQSSNSAVPLSSSPLQPSSVRPWVGASSPEEYTETRNEHAVAIMERVKNKLSGRDFAGVGPLDVPEQVDRLIQQATSVTNLCQCYMGWCPFW